MNMSLPVFPDITLPVIPEAANNSFQEDFPDSTISSTTDAKYKITRPRATRMPGAWDYSWVGLSSMEYAALVLFWKQVNGTAGMFLWKEPISGQQKIVRFSAKGKWTQYHEGWRGSLSFEEV
jgi:hypothetical protein